MENHFSDSLSALRIWVMPFGLVNAPATFQAMMNTILREFLDHGVIVYLDDILIYSKSLKAHKALIEQVLARLEQDDLVISLKKSVFHVDTVEFLGYIVGQDGVTMSKKKVESILSWKAPPSVKDVEIFIGFANFYRRFREDFSKVCKPITDTLKTERGSETIVLGTITGESYRRTKTEVHFGSYFGTLLPPSKNGNRDRR